MAERDPLEELRVAWRGLEPCEATPEEAPAEDESELEALREVWRALEAPEPRVPWRLRVGAARQTLPALARFLVAAGVLLAAGLWLSRRAPEAVPREVPVAVNEHARVVDSAGPENGLVVAHGCVRLVMLEPVLVEHEDPMDEETRR